MKHLVFCALCISLHLQAGNAKITRIDPPNWWVNMKHNSVQLLVYGPKIGRDSVSTSQSGVTVDHINRVENPNYLFVTINIAPTVAPGPVTLKFHEGDKLFTYAYPLYARESDENCHGGFDASDIIYLLMPDRFANGDTTNDIWKASHQPAICRDSLFQRHGGDLAGVQQHLDYIQQLGVTALWMTPFQENNQPLESYHGYAITDHYRVDPRLGDVQQFKQIVMQLHQRKMKSVMDMVFNHSGSMHWLVQDLPDPNWIHQQDTFVRTNYRAPALVDPYASAFDKNKMSNGWFAPHMPDWNQQHPLVANYLIQNAIWWIETTGIDGFRIDTYTYSDLDFMQSLMMHVKTEYPHFTAVGEIWDHGIAIQSHFQKDPVLCDTRNTHLDGLLDFQMNYAFTEACSKPMDWTGGLSKLYYTLAQDYLYSNPLQNVTFLDNHDFSRFFSMVGEDQRKLKMGLGLLLTQRGIPSIYYGTEILMKNYADPDGKVRSDFPGGWKSDKVNKFNATGRSADENQMFQFISQLTTLRKKWAVLQTGALTQFVPENDTYVYFRKNDNRTVMMVVRYSENEQLLPLLRFQEFLYGHRTMTNALTGETVTLGNTLQVAPMSFAIYELK
ncbi:MAG: alpha-amylase family glycosyl hydrolase [Chitinophagales bacterium]